MFSHTPESVEQVEHKEVLAASGRLLTPTMNTSNNEEADCNKADESDADAEIPRLLYRLSDMRTLLMRPDATNSQDGSPQKRARVTPKHWYKESLTIIENVWGCVDTRPLTFNRKDCGPRHVGEAASHVAARRQKCNDMQEVCPSPQTHLLRDTLYPIRTSELLATWLTELQHQPEHPTAEQLMLLKTIVDRIAFEAAAEQ